MMKKIIKYLLFNVEDTSTEETSTEDTSDKVIPSILNLSLN